MALVATGAYWVQQEGMILERLGKLWSFLPSFWQKPLWTCAACMVSTWGTPVWLAMHGAHIEPYSICVQDVEYVIPLLRFPGPFWHLPIDLLAAAGLAAYLNK